MIARYLAGTAAWIVAIGAVLFAAAGDARWPQAWLFLAEYALLAGALVTWLARHDPALLRERFAVFHRRQAQWDRAFLGGVAIVFVAWLVVIALDARRFTWSHVPVPLQSLGAVALAASVLATWRVFRANSFAVPQVRVQPERRQVVIDTGPYRWVRHPMYAGGLVYFVGVPLMLGSWLGLALVPVLVAAMGARAVGEERMLRRELAGYDAYAARVRWRLVPGVW